MTGTRHARCACGAATVTATGAPAFVAICSCGQCRRRTGSAFGVSAYFKREQVTVAGEVTIYRRLSAKGRPLDMRFCPTCGTTLWWEAAFRPDQIGIAGGAFDDAASIVPTYCAWDAQRMPWLVDIEALERHAGSTV